MISTVPSLAGNTHGTRIPLTEQSFYTVHSLAGNTHGTLITIRFITLLLSYATHILLTEQSFYTVHSLEGNTHGTLILHSTSYTPHPTPHTHTLHPAPYTLHPTPYNLYPTPYTLHNPRQNEAQPGKKTGEKNSARKKIKNKNKKLTCGILC